MQVDYVEQSQNQVHLKLIPRTDYSKLRGALKGSNGVSPLDFVDVRVWNYFRFQDQEKRKKFSRPPLKLFDVDAIRAIGGEVTSDGDFLIFENNRYSRKGFLFKSFAMSAIVSDI